MHLLFIIILIATTDVVFIVDIINTLTLQDRNGKGS